MLTTDLTQIQEQEQARFIAKVYGWMAGALAITALVAMWVVSTPAVLEFIFSSRYVFMGLIIVELICVGALVGAIDSFSPQTATAVFIGYAVLNGLTLSSVFLAYTSASIVSTFFVTATTFGIMSTYGYFTKKDLTSIGNLCFMALIGLIIASLVNMFLQNEIIYWVTTFIGIIIFVGLIAYDTQKIKAMYQSGRIEGDNVRKGAILGALSLYLDFINLFLMLLRLFGRKK
ncbi:MAG TPA: Bax inhibitor-1/YccA family protein [Chitinophagales bacterium]|nr:Bax inhibitor-1/YccA family protein [Chitinophagales bacterium]